MCYGLNDFMSNKVSNSIQNTMIVITCNSKSTDLCQGRLQICIFAPILPITVYIKVVAAELQIKWVIIDNSRVISASYPYLLLPTAFIEPQDGNFTL